MPQQGSAPQAPKTGMGDQDKQLVQMLQSIGASEQQIQQALAMLHSGVPVEQILDMLTQGVQQ